MTYGNVTFYTQATAESKPFKKKSPTCSHYKARVFTWVASCLPNTPLCASCHLKSLQVLKQTSLLVVLLLSCQWSRTVCATRIYTIYTLQHTSPCLFLPLLLYPRHPPLVCRCFASFQSMSKTSDGCQPQLDSSRLSEWIRKVIWWYLATTGAVWRLGMQ